MKISHAIDIPDEEIHLTFVRSSGPGGQNVNKVATAAQLRFDDARSTSIPDDVRERLMKLAGQRVTDDGVLVIEARNSRSQSLNRQSALARFRELVRLAEKRPRRRRRTAPTQASVERRLRDKKARSDMKRQRRRPHGDE